MDRFGGRAGSGPEQAVGSDCVLASEQGTGRCPATSSCPLWPDCLVGLSGLDLGPVALPHLEDVHTCWELSLGQHFAGRGGG